MISYLSGKILELDHQTVEVLTSHGVGYEVHINELIFAKIVEREDISLHIYHHISESTQSLYGFYDKEDKKVFKELLKISGVGGKVAMQILSLGTARLLQAVAEDDQKTIQSIKGVGKKMSEKIILDMKDKDFAISYETNDSKENLGVSLEKNVVERLTQTLENMGYQKNEIEHAFLQIPNEIEDVSIILPLLIKELS